MNLVQIPRLFQSHVHFIIEKLNIQEVKLDLARLLRNISETNPSFFKDEIAHLIKLLYDKDFNYRLNLWGILRNITYDEPELIKNNISEIINLIKNENLKFEAIELLKIIGRKNPDLFKDNIELLLDFFSINEIRADITDILLNISLRYPHLLYEYILDLFNLLEYESSRTDIIEIIRNILKLHPKILFPQIPIYLEKLTDNYIINELYSEIKKMILKNKEIIVENYIKFKDFIIKNYNYAEINNDLIELELLFKKSPLILQVITKIKDKCSSFNEYIENFTDFEKVPPKTILFLIDYIIILKNFSSIFNKYIKIKHIFEDKEERKDFYQMLLTFKNGIEKLYGKIKKTH